MKLCHSVHPPPPLGLVSGREGAELEFWNFKFWGEVKIFLILGGAVL